MIHTAGQVIIPRVSPHLWKIRKALRKHLNHNESYVLGLSGGSDSLALAAALSAEKYRVKAVIIDHQLQEDSAEFSRRAADHASQLGLINIVHRVTVPDNGEGMEAAARSARYDALQQYGDKIITGHTKNDQAETVLLGLARGSGARSISGMSMISHRDNGSTIIRPMLENITREDTVGSCIELGLDYWSDPQNDDTSYKRVDVRKNLIPMMKEVLGNGVENSLVNTANQLQDMIRYVDHVTENAYSKHVHDNKVDAKSLAAEDDFIIAQVVTKFLRDNDFQLKNASVNAVINMVTNWSGQGASHFREGHVERKNGFLIITRR